MELDATQQQKQKLFVSKREREQRQNKKLCFEYGRLRYMSKNCRQQCTAGLS